MIVLSTYNLTSTNIIHNACVKYLDHKKGTPLTIDLGIIKNPNTNTDINHLKNGSYNIYELGTYVLKLSE